MGERCRTLDPQDALLTCFIRAAVFSQAVWPQLRVCHRQARSFFCSGEGCISRAHMFQESRGLMRKLVPGAVMSRGPEKVRLGLEYAVKSLKGVTSVSSKPPEQ